MGLVNICQIFYEQFNLLIKVCPLRGCLAQTFEEIIFFSYEMQLKVVN